MSDVVTGDAVRPRSITVISWLEIVLNLLSGGVYAATQFNPALRAAIQKTMEANPISIPFDTYALIAIVASFVTVIFGFAMLKGANWGRWGIMVVGILGIAMAFIVSPVLAAILPSVVIFAIIAFFLFRPKANAFFAGPNV